MASWKPLMKRAWSGSVIQWYGSTYPDQYHKVTDPEHLLNVWLILIKNIFSCHLFIDGFVFRRRTPPGKLSRTEKPSSSSWNPSESVRRNAQSVAMRLNPARVCQRSIYKYLYCICRRRRLIFMHKSTDTEFVVEFADFFAPMYSYV